MKDYPAGKKYSLRDIYLILSISFLLSSPLLSGGLFTAHDIHCHMYKFTATVEALREGQLPPLIGPGLANGFGYSWNIFYAPLSAYIPAFLKIFIPTFTETMKVFLFLTIFLSGITMYCLSLDISLCRSTSLLASVLYLTAPYRLEDIYIRGAVGEALAFVFIPVFFQGLYSLFNLNGKKDHYIALGFAGLLLAHNISALMAAFAALVFLLVYRKRLADGKVLKALALNGGFIILFSLFYLVPLLEHRISGDYVVFQPEAMGSPAGMEAHSLYPRQLLFSMFNKGELNLNLGLQLVIPLVLAPLVFKQIKTVKVIALFLFLGLGSILLTTGVFPWAAVPSFFSFIQFPWRFLVLAVFFLSISCAFIINKLYRELEIKHLVSLVLIIMVYISPVLSQTANDSKISDQDFIRIDEISEKSRYSRGSAFFEYMPVKARENIPYVAARKDGVIITSGRAEVTNEYKSGTSLSFDITALSDAVIELPYLYYLGYRIALQSGDHAVYLAPRESDKGFVSFAVPAGTKGSVYAEYQSTVLTRTACILSLFSFLLFIPYVRYKNRLR